MTRIGVVAAERSAELNAVHPDAILDPPVTPPPSRARAWTRADAIVELLRGRLTLDRSRRPRTHSPQSLEIDDGDADAALSRSRAKASCLRGRAVASLRTPT